MQSLDDLRQSEHAKYVRAYQGRYGMGSKRLATAVEDLRRLPCRGSYLDVGCGRGEMLEKAARLGFSSCRGTEIVPDLIDHGRVVYGEVHELPFAESSFDVVTMFDVIEHLIPGDDELACEELYRVAVKHILIAANNSPSACGAFVEGEREELHINRRAYREWDSLFRQWFPESKVQWLKYGDRPASQTWRIDLPERSNP